MQQVRCCGSGSGAEQRRPAVCPGPAFVARAGELLDTPLPAGCCGTIRRSFCEGIAEFGGRTQLDALY